MLVPPPPPEPVTKMVKTWNADALVLVAFTVTVYSPAGVEAIVLMVSVKTCVDPVVSWTLETLNEIVGRFATMGETSAASETVPVNC